MFERFHERARLVVVTAQEEARGLRHAAIGGEHLLLGICAVDSALLGSEVHVLRRQVLTRSGAGTTDAPEFMPFTAPARRALETAAEQAADRGASDVLPAHVLLALLDVDPAVGELLGDLGRTVEAMREAVDAALRAPPARAPADPIDALQRGHPVVVTFGDGLPLGDLGHPRTDGRVLEAMLVAGGPAGRLLRDHGVDEQALRDLRRH